MFLVLPTAAAEILRRDGRSAASLHGIRTCGIIGAKVTEEAGSGNLRMLAVACWDVPVTGLMASCDIIGERSMQYGTYASANS